VTVHLAFAGLCVVTFAAYALGALRAWRRWREGRAARTCAVFVALANLLFLAWFAASVRTLGEATPLPWSQRVLLVLGITSAIVATLLPACTMLAWREGWWTRRGRVSYTLVAACAVGFATWLDYWKLLGFRY
jgi:hypothetical protein